MKALRRFTVRATLPAPLAPLGELVMNLRWSWHPETRDLFAEVSPTVWEQCAGDPQRLLGAVSAERLDELAADEGFLARLAAASADLHDYLTRALWFQGLADAPAAIGYFSPEFGVTEVLPQYSGGLGILAGDHLKAASDLGVPIIGVGLLYRAGYFTQSLSADGWQLERYPAVDPYGLPLTLLRTADGAALKVSLDLPGGRVLTAAVWLAQVGRVPLLLLDSDVEENDEAARGVTDRLYGGGSDHRLAQELLLGVGGVRAIRAFCELTGHVAPEVFHTNEGHAGFLGVERIRELVAGGLAFDEALEATRAGTLFTTHTPVPAGIDRFPRDLVGAQFGGDNALPGVPVEKVLALGAEPDGDPDVFNMAFMGLRLAQRANGVAKLHGAVSRGMFNGLWPGFDADEVPITSVTNGVHAPTWVAREVFELGRSAVGPQLVDEAQGWEAIASVPDADVWAVRRTLRSQLVDEVRRRVRASWLERGASPAELGWAEEVFDPDVLTVGFARRVPSYKRLTLMMRDPERLRAILLDPERPVQFVVAGKSHPADDGGKSLIQQMVRFADDPGVRHRIVFLPDYEIGMAKHLYHGCDVWLNNPLRPLEACGTSGMKSALNGGLNLSILDGWWDEMFDGDNGWAIPSADGVDAERRDDLEAAALYEILDAKVKPRFYCDKTPDGVPQRWVAQVKHTLQSLGPQVLASRMVRDYVQQLYTPTAQANRSLSADGHSGAKQLAAWRASVTSGWPLVRVGRVEAAGAGDSPELGAVVDVRAEVDLGLLRPSDLVVQALYGRVGDHDEITSPSTVALADAGDGVFTGQVPLDRTGPFGWTVRVLPSHPLLPNRAALGLVTAPAEDSGYTEMP